MSIINHTRYKLKENLKIENGKNIEQKIMKPKVQCQQIKIDAQNDKNQMTIEGMNALYAETFRKERKLFRLCETERAEIVLVGNKI